ncbi:conjugative transposon TraN protein [human gut metagenome]|uniref:Conjugative transposon TraN protein n=1 Tax=human gut metagenome TaxID=408170 RepID=K1U7D7_9ZZZZ
MKYAAEPLLLNVEMCDFIHDGDGEPPEQRAGNLPERAGQRKPDAGAPYHEVHPQAEQAEVKHIGCKRFGIQYLLKGIYTHNGFSISTRK